MVATELNHKQTLALSLVGIFASLYMLVIVLSQLCIIVGFLLVLDLAYYAMSSLCLVYVIAFLSSRVRNVYGTLNKIETKHTKE